MILNNTNFKDASVDGLNIIHRTVFLESEGDTSFYFNSKDVTPKNIVSFIKNASDGVLFAADCLYEKGGDILKVPMLGYFGYNIKKYENGEIKVDLPMINAFNGNAEEVISLKFSETGCTCSINVYTGEDYETQEFDIPDESVTELKELLYKNDFIYNPEPLKIKDVIISGGYFKKDNISIPFENLELPLQKPIEVYLPNDDKGTYYIKELVQKPCFYNPFSTGSDTIVNGIELYEDKECTTLAKDILISFIPNSNGYVNYSYSYKKNGDKFSRGAVISQYTIPQYNEIIDYRNTLGFTLSNNVLFAVILDLSKPYETSSKFDYLSAIQSKQTVRFVINQKTYFANLHNEQFDDGYGDEVFGFKLYNDSALTQYANKIGSFYDEDGTFKLYNQSSGTIDKETEYNLSIANQEIECITALGSL